MLPFVDLCYPLLTCITLRHPVSLCAPVFPLSLVSPCILLCRWCPLCHCVSLVSPCVPCIPNVPVSPVSPMLPLSSVPLWSFCSLCPRVPFCPLVSPVSLCVPLHPLSPPVFLLSLVSFIYVIEKNKNFYIYSLQTAEFYFSYKVLMVACNATLTLLWKS